MRFWLTVLGFFLGISASFADKLVSKKEMNRHVDQTLTTVSQLRGQKKPKKFTVDLTTKEKLKDYVHKTLTSRVGPDQLLLDSWSPVALKLVEKPIDPKALAKAFAGDNAAGVYDPEKNALYLVSWVPMAQLIPVLAHELTHLLQDDLVPLEKFINIDLEKTKPLPFLPADRAQARHALVEGEAVLMMALTLEKAQGAPGLLTSSDDTSFFLGQLETQTQQIAQKLEVPKVMVASAVFSYSQGYPFARALWKNGGFKRLKNAFSCPPFGTVEILDPKRYLKRTANCTSQKPSLKKTPLRLAIEEELSERKLKKKILPFVTDTGAWGTRLFVKHHQEKNPKPKWLDGYVGDEIYYVFSPTGKIKRAGFMWHLRWKTRLEAELGFADFNFMTRSVLGSTVKPAKAKVFKQTSGRAVARYESKDEGTEYAVLRQGKNLFVLWNLQPELVAKLRKIVVQFK